MTEFATVFEPLPGGAASPKKARAGLKAGRDEVLERAVAYLEETLK